MEMSYLRLEHVSTPFCLKDINLEFEKGEFSVIIGASGAGKSTILNTIAGFISHDGSVFIENRLLNKIPTQKRDIGYLPQAIYLFPNLSVYENIAFGLRAKRVKEKEIDKRVYKMMEMLKISHLKDRYPKTLSGGEKQRVGLARSIILQPKVLLLDEPLSSLDQDTASIIRKELKNLHKELNLTVIYVTHNLIDVNELAQKVVHIESGQIKKVELIG